MTLKKIYNKFYNLWVFILNIFISILIIFCGINMYTKNKSALAIEPISDNIFNLTNNQKYYHMNFTIPHNCQVKIMHNNQITEVKENRGFISKIFNKAYEPMTNSQLINDKSTLFIHNPATNQLFTIRLNKDNVVFNKLSFTINKDYSKNIDLKMVINDDSGEKIIVKEYNIDQAIYDPISKPFIDFGIFSLGKIFYYILLFTYNLTGGWILYGVFTGIIMSYFMYSKYKHLQQENKAKKEIISIATDENTNKEIDKFKVKHSTLLLKNSLFNAMPFLFIYYSSHYGFNYISALKNMSFLGMGSVANVFSHYLLPTSISKFIPLSIISILMIIWSIQFMNFDYYNGVQYQMDLKSRIYSLRYRIMSIFPILFLTNYWANSYTLGAIISGIIFNIIWTFVPYLLYLYNEN